MTENEKVVNSFFRKFADKPGIGEWKNLVELWHFIGCVEVEGVHLFLNYKDFQDTLNSLSFFGFYNLRTELESLSKLVAVGTNPHLIRDDNPEPFDKFEESLLELERESIVEKMFLYCKANAGNERIKDK